jgi:hypothetical protein
MLKNMTQNHTGQDDTGVQHEGCLFVAGMCKSKGGAAEAGRQGAIAAVLRARELHKVRGMAFKLLI